MKASVDQCPSDPQYSFGHIYADGGPAVLDLGSSWPNFNPL